MILKELLRVIEEIKKDLAYTQRLEERWTSEQKRFPLIYKYIIKQRESFQEQIEKTLGMDIDTSRLDEYVRSRPEVKIDRMKTAQVTPPKQEPGDQMLDEFIEDTPAPKAPEPVIDAPKTATQKPSGKRPAAVPEPLDEEETKTADKALEAAAAEAALKLRQDSPEPSTQSVAKTEPVEKKEDLPEQPPKKDAKSAGDAVSSREKLRRLASEVLNEVKKSKTD